MSDLELSKRKVRLQNLIIEDLSRGSNHIRYKEQKKVYDYLLKPEYLYASEIKGNIYDYDLNFEVSKYLRVLTNVCKNDNLYELSLKRYGKTMNNELTL